MMTETEILDLKVQIFSTEECLYKLLEELAEARDAAEALLIDARYSKIGRASCRERVFGRV